MKSLFIALALIGLVLVLVPSLLHYFGKLEADQMKTYIFIGTMLWFSGAIPWLGKKRADQ
jgi:membrane protease YdiL (CAAX protease family)